MAQKVNIVLVDDIDGGEADETVTFALDGKDYEIDLTDANAQKLRDALALYVGHARSVSRAGRGGGGRSRRRSSGAAASGGPSPSEIRDWAKDQGMEVNERGRISAEVREAYDAAH